MDNLRGRRPGQSAQPAFEDYQPLVEWGQDPENHLLRVVLPDFRREEVRVQVDNAGKLAVRGRRQTGDGKIMRLDQSFEVPKDAKLDKISGRFEDGCLFLIMPRIRRLEPAAIAAEAAKLPPPDNSTSTPSQEKKEPVAKKPDPVASQVPKPAPVASQVPPSLEKSSTASSIQEKKEVLKQKEEPSVAADKQTKKLDSVRIHESNKQNNNEQLPETKINEKLIDEDKLKKEAERKIDELKNAGEKIGEELKNTAESLYKSIENEVEGDDEGWLMGYGVVLDDMLVSLKKNRAAIVVAVVAFSVGFYVSRKLRAGA